jgi:hypothetical protein
MMTVRQPPNLLQETILMIGMAVEQFSAVKTPRFRADSNVAAPDASMQTAA